MAYYAAIKHTGPKVAVARKIRTSNSEDMYDVLRDLGCDHETAENIAAWAEHAPVGEAWTEAEPDIEVEIIEE